MNTLYNLTERLQSLLEGNALINTASYGDIDAVDLDKQTIFPLAHLNLTEGTIGSSTASVGVSLLLMDIVDESKTEDVDKFIGNDNELDVLNSMLAAGTKIVQEFIRGTEYSNFIQMDGDASFEFFADRFENKLAGVSIDFQVTIRNSADLC